MLALVYRLLLLNYRRAARWYWEVRAHDVYRLYGAEERDFPTLRAIFARYRPASVLDLGCGAGRLFRLYREAGITQVLGVDISGRALELARRRYPDVLTLRARAEDLAADQAFDMLLVTRVLQHLPPENLPRVIETTARIARHLIYLNEIGESDAGVGDLAGGGYIFKHNYRALYTAHGWQPIEQGVIEGTRQTYLLLAPTGTEAQQA